MDLVTAPAAVVFFCCLVGHSATSFPCLLATMQRLRHGGLLSASVCQTAFRAELFAVGYALHWAAALQTKIRLWTDCLGVINKFQLLV